MIAWIQMPGGADTGSWTGDPRVIPVTTVGSLTVRRHIRVGHTRSFARLVAGTAWTGSQKICGQAPTE